MAETSARLATTMTNILVLALVSHAPAFGLPAAKIDASFDIKPILAKKFETAETVLGASLAKVPKIFDLKTKRGVKSGESVGELRKYRVAGLAAFSIEVDHQTMTMPGRHFGLDKEGNKHFKQASFVYACTFEGTAKPKDWKSAFTRVGLGISSLSASPDDTPKTLLIQRWAEKQGAEFEAYASTATWDGKTLTLTMKIGE